jgi:hypothetical protein
MKPLDACYYLRNKALYFPPPVDAALRKEPLSTPCWCLRTHEPLGPDGGHVTLESCRKGRECYRPEVEL